MATRIQNRRDTSSNWTNNNPTLSDGEIGFETDTGLFKIGKNNTSWTSLEYSQNSPPGFELDAKIQNFDPNTYPQDDDVTNSGDMEIGDVLVLDADTAKAVFKIGDRVRANSVSQREYVFSDLSSSLFNSASANIGDTFTFTTTNPNLAIKVGASLVLYNDTNPIFGTINVLVTSISSNRLTYTCELQYIDKPLVEEVPEDFTTTSWNALFSLGSTPPYHYPSVSSGFFDEGDSLAGLIPYAYLEGIVTDLTEDSISITIDNYNQFGSPIWFKNMKIFFAPARNGLDGLSYDIYPNYSFDGLVPPSNNDLYMTKEYEGSTTVIYGAPTLFKAGDWIKGVYMDRNGSEGNANTIYPDVYFEGYVYEILPSDQYSHFYTYSILVTKINGGYKEGTNVSQWTTGLLPEPKATYDFPPFIYPVGDPNAGFRTAPPDRPSSVGEEYTIQGQPGLYQVGQKIRMQALDEFGVAIPGDYSIVEVLGIQKYIEGTQPDGLDVKCLETYVQFNVIPYSLSFSLHASDGPQGPGYEVTYDSNVHTLPDDVSTVWDNYGLSQTSWNVGNQYTIPGDFSNSSFQIGSYVKYYFGDPSFPDTPYIEGWIYQFEDVELPTFARILVQRWSNNSNWYSVAGYMPTVQPIFPAHFEPGYNFDMRINVSGGYVQAPFTNLEYPTFLSDIEYGTSRSFYGYHRGSYNPGDYVVISSKSNPGIKVFAYIGSIGYADFADQFYIYPLEVLTWDASEEDTFNDWTLSIASPPKKEYKLSNPLPLFWDAAVDPVPEAYLPVGQSSKPLLLDVVPAFGDPGLFEVGDLVRAVSKSEPTAAFYGEITELGSASNSFVNLIEVSDVSEWTEDQLNAYNDWELSLGQKPVEYQLATPEKITTFQNINITAEDMGKIIYTSNGDPITITVDPSANSVPQQSQVTIIQRWNGPVTIVPGPNSGTIYFAETDGITEGAVTLKGIYSAATLINAEGFWILIGSFGSAEPYNPNPPS
jgi:hypothetical protein